MRRQNILSINSDPLNHMYIYQPLFQVSPETINALPNDHTIQALLHVATILRQNTLSYHKNIWLGMFC